MDFLRKFLVRLRREYYQDGRKYFLVLGGATAALALLTLLLDFLAPFHSWGVILRSFILVPTALAIFSTGYGISLYMHQVQMDNNEDWAPYRSRFSPRWRLQISAVVGAVLFVFSYASGRGVGYTLTSSVIAAVVVGLLAFVRSTQEEAKRSRLGVPDARDVSYDARKRIYDREQKLKKDAKTKKKQERS